MLQQELFKAYCNKNKPNISIKNPLLIRKFTYAL
jgi:hypothetical protein